MLLYSEAGEEDIVLRTVANTKHVHRLTTTQLNAIDQHLATGRRQHTCTPHHTTPQY
jgi:hypothetical protein